MSELKIRKAENCDSDIDAAAEIEQLSFPYPWSRNAIAEEICKNPSARFFLAETDGKICGSLSCWMLPPYECQVGNVAVHPDHRRQHIADALIEELIKTAFEEGISDISLEVRVSNLPAISLYKKHGFAEEGRRKNYYEGKEDAIIMWLRK